MNRGTEAVWPSEGGFTFLCDCGTENQVVVTIGDADAGRPVAVADQEVAITCGSCGSAHWLTITGGKPDG